jgi:hypothetical protein
MAFWRQPAVTQLCGVFVKAIRRIGNAFLALPAAAAAPAPVAARMFSLNDYLSYTTAGYQPRYLLWLADYFSVLCCISSET